MALRGSPERHGRIPSRLERRCFVDVAASFYLPLPTLIAVAGGAFGGSFDLLFSTVP
jgi:hypothetical protein